MKCLREKRSSDQRDGLGLVLGSAQFFGAVVSLASLALTEAPAIVLLRL